MKISHTVFATVVTAAVFAAAVMLVYCIMISHSIEKVITPTRTLSIGGTSLYIAIADTPQGREQGLSGTTSLKPDQGMLFLFEKDDQYSFWMKDMNYPIDILWISAQKRVVYIEKDVSPDTFPQAFTPDTPARYVLEVPAGFSDAHGVAVGSVVAL